MHEYQSQDITTLAKALIQVQRNLQPAFKDATNLFTKSHYATLNSVMAQDGRPCIVATGQTQPKKKLLLGAGFKWNAQRKMWWRYADAA